MTSDCRANRAVLHLIDTTGPGGAETVFVTLAEKMQCMAYRSVVVIRGPGWVQDELHHRGLKPLIIDAKGSFNITFLWSLISLIRREKISLIHSHLLGSNVYAAMAGLLTATPVVATYHGMVDISPNERFKRFKHAVMRWGISRYVAVSKRLMANIMEQGLLSLDRTSVIYNGVDMGRYGQKCQPEIERDLGLPESAFLIGSLGNIRKAKAYHILVEAAVEVIKAYPNVHFIIAGDKKASIMTSLEALLSRHGISEHFHFLGFRQDGEAILAQMDMFVLPSSSEGFSISTIEAMASGLPVLVTRCGGPEEIVTHAENGWMVDPDHPGKLAEGLLHLLDNPDLCGRLAVAGKQHAADKFDMERMLDGYRQIYQELIA